MKAKHLIEQSEQNFIYSGIALFSLIEFITLLLIYLNYLSKTFLIPLGLLNIVICYIFLDGAFKGKKKLEKIKEIEQIRDILRERKKK